MQDLKLWQLLQQPECDESQVLSLLRELAKTEISYRCVFFARVVSLLEHDSPEIRAAALDAFSGTTGWTAFQKIIDRMNDDDAGVRAAAVAAMVAGAEADRSRWGHGLFHPSAEIRQRTLQAAITSDASAGLAQDSLYLLASPDHHDAVEKLVASSELLYPNVPLLRDLLNSGKISRQQARLVLSRCPLREALLLSLPPAFTLAQAEAITQGSDPPDQGDAIAWMLELFWQEPSHDEAIVYQRFVDELTSRRRFPALGSPLPKRLIAAAIVVAEKLGYWNDAVAAYCTFLDPFFLTIERVPAEVRRRTIASLYELGTRAGEQKKKVVVDILKSDICRRPSGQLDLWAIGGVLFLRRKESYELLLSVHGEKRIIAAFWEDPEGSAPLFCQPESPKIRKALLMKIINQRRTQRPFVLAMMLHVVPANAQDFLDELTRDEALDVVAGLLSFALRSEIKFSDNRRRAACESLVQRIGNDGLLDFLKLWLAGDQPKLEPVGMEMLANFGRMVSGDEFVAAVSELDNGQIKKLLDAICGCPGFPYGTELQLAISLMENEDKTINGWALGRVPSDTLQEIQPPRETSIAIDLDPKLAEAIVCCDEADLRWTLQPCLTRPYRGLCAALIQRQSAVPDPVVCAAVLASRDSIEEVDQALAAYSENTNRFWSELDQEMVARWKHCSELSMVGNAWLFRWEFHAFAFGEQTMQSELATAGCLQTASKLKSRVLAQQLWEAVARAFALYRARDPESAARLLGDKLGRQLLRGLSTDCDGIAARMLDRIYSTGFVPEWLARLHPKATGLLPTLSEQVRKILSRWLDCRGLGPPVAKRAERTEQTSDLSDRISASTNLDELQAWCSRENANVVSDAIIRLLELGEAGCQRIVDTLRQTPAVPCAAMIADSVSMWPQSMLEAARKLLEAANIDAQIRFLIGLNLLEAGESKLVDFVFDVLCEPIQQSWMQPSDLQRMRKITDIKAKMPFRLSISPHPVAYTDAVMQIITSPKLRHDQQAYQAIRRFLLVEGDRPEGLRNIAATWLGRFGDHLGFPIRLRAMIRSKPSPNAQALPPTHVAEAVEVVLLAGPGIVDEQWFLDMLQLRLTSDAAYHQAAARLMEDGVSIPVRKEAALLIRTSTTRSEKLRRVAETFAWGIPLGRELTGRVFRVEMIGDEDLGYTRLNENRIYISPLPILRQVKHGREIVQGLILHEYGHHMYHRGEAQQRIWARAEKKGLHKLLNLVADEHLERNLRAKDRSYGDRLKRLGAFAFQHNRRSYRLSDLLTMLGARALDILPKSHMRVCRSPAQVTIDGGQLLQELERHGSSFSRFFRALRMGLGNRYDDPKVEAGLKLFHRKFRHNSMNQLMDVVMQLNEIFGAECQMLECIDQDTMVTDDDSLSDTEGISNQEIQSEIRRITKPPKGRTSRGRGKPSGPRWINVSNVEHFDQIYNIVRVPHDPESYAAYAKQVQRDAQTFRRYMEELGIRYEPFRRRLQGRRLDRPSIQRLVTRTDPRILIAREPQTATDLFLGVVIDCSGSMDFQQNIEKAKLFGAMLSEAAKGNHAIDLRLFGFTHDTIYDAGDAYRPGIAALHSEGGNNDAAALYHAACVANGSRRRAKLLVMISDGLPTECSTEALKSLVAQLSHRTGLCLAQVAVQPLEEVCFPHYIELGTRDQAAAVRQFGQIVARLVRKAMA